SECVYPTWVSPSCDGGHRTAGAVRRLSRRFALSLLITKTVRNGRVSPVKVGVENGDLGDPIDGEVVSLGRTPDRFRIWTVVNAERRQLVFADVGVNPRHADFGVFVDDAKAGRSPFFGDWDTEPIRKRTLDYVPGHQTTSNRGAAG